MTNDLSLGPCNVCGREALGVCCSGLVAVSFAFCRECLLAGAEPYGVLVYTVAAVRGGGHSYVAYPSRGCVEATLSRTAKTREQFDADVAKEVLAL